MFRQNADPILHIQERVRKPYILRGLRVCERYSLVAPEIVLELSL